MSAIVEIRVDRESVNDDVVEVVRVLKASGEIVRVGDELIEYETSKSSVLITAETAGRFYTSWAPGDEVPVGGVIASIHGA